MDVYLLNLDRRPDRLAKCAAQLHELGIPFVRVSAVDGQKPNAQVARVNLFKFIINNKRKPSRGELACAASHISIWKQFLESDSSHALVLEDDVKIHPQLKIFMTEFLDELEIDFLNLSSNSPYKINSQLLGHLVEQCSTRPAKQDRKARKKWRQLEFGRSWRIFKLYKLTTAGFVCECDPAPALTSGYIISRKAAESFLETSKDLFFPIDYVWRYCTGTVRQGFLAEPIVVQEGGDSDITGRSDQARMPLCYRLLRPFLKSRRLGRRLDVLRIYGLGKH